MGVPRYNLPAALALTVLFVLGTTAYVVAVTASGAGRITGFAGVQVAGLPDSACTTALAFADMPGMALRFTLSRPGQVVVLFQGQFGGFTSTANARAAIRFAIDGSTVGSAIAVGNDHGRGLQTFGFNAFSGSLTAGTHVARVLWRTSPSGAKSCVEERSLIVLRGD
jgi:hypothetical protein